MKKVLTIGGGNGHSHILSALYESFLDKIELKAIVSMSDDGRTTGKLMYLFKKNFGIYFPPPWDLRRCLFAVSDSKYRDLFSLIFEEKFNTSLLIKDLTLEWLFTEMLEQVFKSKKHLLKKYEKEIEKFFAWDWNLRKYMERKLSDFWDKKLLLNAPLAGHKLGNIVMALIFYHVNDYNTMLDIMHDFFKTKGQVIPVTTDKARIQAILENGDYIVSQDAISNIADYTEKIAYLELTPDSENAHHTASLDVAIKEADFIIITPWDLYTSTISNLIIWGIKESIKNSKAHIIYIANSTNKWGETTGYRILDFVDEVEKYLGRAIDILFVNDKLPNLSSEALERLKENISVKGGDFIFLSKEERKIVEKKWVKIVEKDFIDKKMLYKHNKKKIAEELRKMIL